MKIVLDLKSDRDPKENDVIIFKNNAWTVVSRESFLSKYTEMQAKELNGLQGQINALNTQIEKLQGDLVKLAIIVKEK